MSPFHYAILVLLAIAVLFLLANVFIKSEVNDSVVDLPDEVNKKTEVKQLFSIPACAEEWEMEGM